MQDEPEHDGKGQWSRIAGVANRWTRLNIETGKREHWSPHGLAVSHPAVTSVHVVGVMGSSDGETAGGNNGGA